MSDEVVSAVRRIRERYAARFNHDLDAIYLHLKERERVSGRHYVNLVGAPKKQAHLQVRR
jgi:hypothetical protein